VRKGKKSNWRGDRTQSTVWEVKNLNPHGGNKDEKQTGHGTQKPVELMRRPILNHTERGDTLYDSFLGSGSTVIAAEQTERVRYGLDIDAKYVDVAVLRWQAQSASRPSSKATIAHSRKWHRNASLMTELEHRSGGVDFDSSAREHLLILFRAKWPFSFALVVLGRRNTAL